MDKVYRVAVWSTGGIGSIAIHAIHERANFELVGVWVHNPQKVGRDAGELAGGKPIGVTATNDFDALVALQPDAVFYAASGPERDNAAVRDYVRLLEAGINVVTTTSTHLINPDTYDAEHRAALEAAAQKGKATIYNGGIEPGFVADYLPVVLATQSKTIRKVHSYEIGLYDDYGVAFIMREGMGFGMPMEFKSWMEAPGGITKSWTGQITLVAKALGVEVQEIRSTFEKAASRRTFDVAFGTVEAGTCGAIRARAIGIVDGKEAIVVEHITRLAHDIAPDWPRGVGNLSYKIVIEGEPRIETVMEAVQADPAAVGIGWMSSGAGAMVCTAMRALNAIPSVIAAEPGIATSFSLPLTVPTGIFKP
jgi:hypothetical protein